MKKIIWGIAAVFCVQVGFQLAMTAERSNDDYARLDTPLQTGIPYAQPRAVDPGLLDTSTYTGNIVERASLTRLETPHRTISLPSVAVRVARRPAPAPMTTANFKPVVITYDRSGALTDASASARNPVPRTKVDADNDDKRSMIAKIVTKPYDWLKAVGSKLH
ncbi:MAG TPA: hypothetical protein VL501_07080 [Pyrinomonadaceae bacterium]|nr:hypothetical protein [Pyrinomonadaceae bacterium]